MKYQLANLGSGLNISVVRAAKFAYRNCRGLLNLSRLAFRIYALYIRLYYPQLL